MIDHEITLEDSGIWAFRIVDDPDNMIASIGIMHADAAFKAVTTTTNLGPGEAKSLRDWLSARIAEIEE